MHTAFDLIRQAARRTPDHPALVDDVSSRAYTYQSLLDEVDLVAAGLHERGVSESHRFATVLTNRLEHCLVILALCRLGAVPALMNARLKSDEIASLVTTGSIEGAIVLNDTEVIHAVRAALPEGAPLLIVGLNTGSGGIAEIDAFENCRGDVSSLGATPQADPEELAFIFYTSGTTGLPKGVMLPHRTSEPRVLWISPLAGVINGKNLRILGLAPLNHAIGFYGNFLVSLVYNGTYFLQSQFDPTTAVEMIKSQEITLVFTVPTIYQAMLHSTAYSADAFNSLEFILFGGAAIQATLLDKLARDTSARITHIYGTTETMCTLYNPSPDGQPTRVRAGLYSGVRIVNSDDGVDAVVKPGQEGELIVATDTDTIFSGYLDQPEATSRKVRDGWYFTGDFCRLCEDGDLELVGRSDDVIRSGGENVHPEEVEAVLELHPDVLDVAVIGTSNDYWGEMVVAHIVSENPNLTVTALDAHCRESTLARYKRPRGYVFTSALPRSAANKLLRRLLRDVDAEIQEVL